MPYAIRNMLARAAVAALCLAGAFGAVHAANPMLGEVEIQAASRTEKDAGVWVDGQYMGHVKQLRGKSRLYLIPGEHELLFRLVGYQDLRTNIVVEPGGSSRFRLTMQQKSELNFPTEAQTAKLILAVEPEEAAVFVNDQYAGHVERFAGSKGMRLREGTYSIRITLPGYKPFKTDITLQANQSYRIETDLAQGSIADQDDNLIVGRSD